MGQQAVVFAGSSVPLRARWRWRPVPRWAPPPPAPSWAAEADSAFVVTIDSPSVKVGERAVITATISTRGDFKITDS